jgi:hypothetical protein
LPIPGQLATVALSWPTDPNAALMMGVDSGQCPEADFIPQAVRIVFGDSGPITITSLTSEGRRIAICGNQISVADVEPLGSG